MKKYFLAAAIAVLSASMSHAQEVHSDIEFGFAPDSAETTFEIENDTVNDEGIQVFEGSFVTPFGLGRTADSPGFITPAEENLTVNALDRVFVRVLNTSETDATSVGNGFVNFYDPNNPDAGVQSDGGTLTILGNTPDSSTSTETVFDGDVLQSGSALLFLSTASDGDDLSNVPDSTGEDNVVLDPGEIHSHLNFSLELDSGLTEIAAGVLLQFEADLAVNGVADGVIDVVSDPFFLVFNYDLTEDEFENQALPAFGVTESASVPEPASGILLATIGSAILTRRRRRRI